MQKQLDNYLEKEQMNNPFSSALNSPMPLYKGKIVDIDAFTYTWKKVIEQFIAPAELIKNQHEIEQVNSFSLVMSEPSIGISDRLE